MTALTQIVAIDGPAGTGKSSVARAVARRLAMAFLDTGAMYRAATWYAMHRGIGLEDVETLTRAVREMRLALSDGAEGLRVEVDGHDVTAAIREPGVTRNIFRLDELAGVRAHLVELQRAYARRHGPTVAEGRDMGTVVFPDARCKIFLAASLDERARRRAVQLAGQGRRASIDTVRREIEQRDLRTANREVAPLRRAADAINLDTTHMQFEEVVDEVVRLARERLELEPC